MIYNSLKSLLQYEGDVEEEVMMNFVISYTDVFGNTISHSLKEDGENIQVNNDNREVRECMCQRLLSIPACIIASLYIAIMEPISALIYINISGSLGTLSVPLFPFQFISSLG